MPYREVTYMEQMWYLLRYKILELLRKRRNAMTERSHYDKPVSALQARFQRG